MKRLNYHQHYSIEWDSNNLSSILNNNIIDED